MNISIGIPSFCGLALFFVVVFIRKTAYSKILHLNEYGFFFILPSKMDCKSYLAKYVKKYFSEFTFWRVLMAVLLLWSYSQLSCLILKCLKTQNTLDLFKFYGGKIHHICGERLQITSLNALTDYYLYLLRYRSCTTEADAYSTEITAKQMWF